MTLLKHLRLKRDLTQRELAKSADMQIADVSRIETKRIWPYKAWLRRLARALEYEGDPYDLVEEHRRDSPQAE